MSVQLLDDDGNPINKSNNETTRLSPNEEPSFQSWIQKNKITDLDHPDSHYDYRGYWKSINGADHVSGEHFPDTFKQHGHPTFSVESQYSKGANDGGHWEGDKYVPQSNGTTKPQLLDDNGNAIGEHPHSGLTDFLASMPEKTNEFLSKHPIINDLLFGATKTPQGHNLVGPEPMHVPGVRAGFDYLADKIDNPQGEGGYGRGFAAGALHGFGNVASALNPLPKIPEPVGRVDFIPGEETPNAPKGTDFEGIKNRAVDAEIIPDFKASNDVKQLPSFNHDLPAEFAPVDSAVDVGSKAEVKPQTSPDELGYNNVLENQGKKELESLPNGWEHVGDNVEPEPKPESNTGLATKDDFIALADAQRDIPEDAMRHVQHTMSGGVLNPVVEHVGDLTHRMNERNTWDSAGYEFVKDKVEKTLRWLTHDYGFEREMNENIKNNAQYKGHDLAEYTAQIDKALSEYGDAHAQLPAYNEAHKLARDAAVAIGRKDFLTATENLRKLKSHLGTKDEWVSYARQGLAEDKPNTGLATTPDESIAPNEPEQALATVSNEHQVLTKPDTIRSMTGVEDGFLEPKFEQDKIDNTGPVPKPGMAKPEKSVDDASDWDLQFNSMNKLLDKYESTKGISKVITDAQDIKQRWLYSKFREFADIFDGLNDEQAKAVTKLQNHGTGDAAYNQANGITPDMINRADQLKSSFDDLHKFMVQMGVKGNKGETKLGYLSQYFPMMKRAPEGIEEQIKDIWAHYLGKENPFYKLVTTHDPEQMGKISDQVNDMYDKGTSMDPWAAFTMSRTGNMNPADIEWNPRRVIPAYLESAAKVTFDGPAVEKAEGLLKQNAESMSPRLKIGAANYIKNYSGYDAQEPLARDWNSLARSAANKVASSLISFNPGVHLLHAGEIPADILPGLGGYYTGVGIKDFFLNIHKNFQDMARLGLLQDEVKPMAFKTLDEKIDSIGYYRSYVESIVKGIAYRGALAKGLDDGLAHPDAVREAIKVAKDLTLTVDKARQMAALTPESKAGAGGPVVILAGQFKGIPLKYIEQQEDFIKALAANPKALNAWGKVGLAMLGTAGAYAFGKEVNKKLIHIESPTDLIMGATTGPLSDILKRMINDTTLAAKAYQKGDMQQAKNYSIQSVMDVATLFTKGGAQIRKSLPDSISKPGSTGNKGKMRLRFNTKLKP